MAQYKVLDNSVQILGMMHPAGSTVDLTEDDAAPFVKAKAIEPITNEDGSVKGSENDEASDEDKEKARQDQLKDEAKLSKESSTAAEDQGREPADAGEGAENKE